MRARALGYRGIAMRRHYWSIVGTVVILSAFECRAIEQDF